MFEGDDSVFTDPHGLITHDENEKHWGDPWTSLGIATKLEKHDNLNTASFCGNIFAPKDRRTLTNPIAKVVEFAWLPIKYRQTTFAFKMQLLRAKALSFKVSYPDHPVLSAFSSMVLRNTRAYTIRKSIIEGMPTWERDRYLENVVGSPKVQHVDQPGTQSRLLIDSLFKLPISTQLRLEDMFANKHDLSPISLENFVIKSDDTKGIYDKLWDDYVFLDTGKRTFSVMKQPAPWIEKSGGSGLEAVSRLLNTDRLRTMLPANYPYQPVMDTSLVDKPTIKQLLDSVYSLRRFLRKRIA